jgi:hypothetical protein
MRVFLYLRPAAVVQQSETVELFDKSPEGLFGERLAKSFFHAMTNHFEWRRSVELLRDEVFHFTEAEESTSGRIFHDDHGSAARGLRPDYEIAAQFRRGSHVVSSVQTHVLDGWRRG